MERPKVKIKLNKTDIIIESIGWILLITLWSLMIKRYMSLPQIIPTHFNGHGNVDDFGSKNSIFIPTTIFSLVFIIISIINNYPHKFKYTEVVTKENALKEYTNKTRLLRFVKLFLVVLLCIIISVMFKLIDQNLKV